MNNFKVIASVKTKEEEKELLNIMENVLCGIRIRSL